MEGVVRTALVPVREPVMVAPVMSWPVLVPPEMEGSTRMEFVPVKEPVITAPVMVGVVRFWFVE